MVRIRLGLTWLGTAAAILAVVGPAAAHHHHGGHGRHHHAGGRAAVLPYYTPISTVWVVAEPLYSAPWPDECRLFQGNAIIAGTTQAFFGTACRQPDGRWHIVGR